MNGNPPVEKSATRSVFYIGRLAKTHFIYTFIYQQKIHKLQNVKTFFMKLAEITPCSSEKFGDQHVTL